MTRVRKPFLQTLVWQMKTFEWQNDTHLNCSTLVGTSKLSLQLDVQECHSLGSKNGNPPISSVLSFTLLPFPVKISIQPEKIRVTGIRGYHPYFLLQK